MNDLYFREGNVILYRRERSKYFQARIKLQNNKWKRISTGEITKEEASAIACDIYDEIKFKEKNKISLDTRRFKDVARLAISEMQIELDTGYGKKSFVDYISALENYFTPYFGNNNIDTIDYKKLQKFDEWRVEKVGRVLSHSAINNHNSALKRVFKVAVERGWIHTVQVPELRNKGKKE